MVRDDKELHRATHTVDKIVYHVGHHKEDDITVDNLLPVL